MNTLNYTIWFKGFIKDVNPDHATDIIVNIIFIIVAIAVVISFVRFFKVMRRVFVLPRKLGNEYSLKHSGEDSESFNEKKVITVDPYDELEVSGGTDVAVRYIPSLLTGTGIFGTFLGVSIALYSFPENINNSTEMLAGMKTLIPAMKTAFFTSLVGIGCATAFLIWEKVLIIVTGLSERAVLARIYRKYQVQSPELFLQEHSKYLEELTRHSREQSGLGQTMEKMALAADGLHLTVKNMQDQSNPELLARLISDGLDQAVQRHLHSPMAEIAGHLEKLDDFRESSNAIRKSSEQLSYFITKELKTVFGSLEKSLQTAHAAMTETGSALTQTNQVIGNLNNGLDSFISDMNTTLSRQEESFAGTVEEVRKNFHDTAETIATQYTKIHDDISLISGTFNTISTEFRDMIGTGRQAFGEQVQGFEKMLTSQQETSETMFAEIRRLNEESMGRIVETTKSTLEDAVGQTRDTAITMIEQAKGDIGEMGKQFQTISSEFSGMIRTGNATFLTQVQGFEKMLTEQGDASRDMFNEIRHLNEETMSGIVATTKATLETAVTQTRDTAIAMIEQAKEDIGEMGDQFRTISGEFTTIVQEGNQAFKEQSAGFKEMLSEQRTLSESTFSEIRELNKESLNDIVKTTKDTLGQAIAETRDSAISMIDKAKISFEEVVNETNQKLQETLAGVGDELINTSARVQEELGKFREEYTSSLDGFFDRQKDILEKIFNENVENLGELTEKLKKVFEEEYQQQSDLIQRLGVVVAKGTSLTEMQKESMRELASETVSANKEISRNLRGTDQKMKSINESLKEISTVISNNVADQIELFCTKQNEVIKQYQVEVDKHLERVLGDMVSVAEILSAALLAVEGEDK